MPETLIEVDCENMCCAPINNVYSILKAINISQDDLQFHNSLRFPSLELVRKFFGSDLP